MAWLGDEGLPVPALRLVRQREEVARACEDLGYPVVMKIVSPDILHKSELGGVILDVRYPAAAEAAFDALQERAAGRDVRGVVVYPMLPGGWEVLLGLSRDPQVGPVLAFGLGGIYTEVLQDIALRIAPVTADQALEMVRETKAHGMLSGGRGRPAADLTGLCQLLADQGVVVGAAHRDHRTAEGLAAAEVPEQGLTDLDVVTQCIAEIGGGEAGHGASRRRGE